MASTTPPADMASRRVMNNAEIQAVTRRVVHHASESPTTYHSDRPDVFRITVDELEAFIASAPREVATTTATLR